MLAEQTPASLVVFDLIAIGDESLLDTPFSDPPRARSRRRWPKASAPVHLTRHTLDAAEAEEWFDQFEGAGLDGVVAKRLDGPYAPNGRTMLKVKHSRTADVVVAGYRLHKTSTPERPLLGSMLLGLYADDGRLQHVGVCASFSEARRAELLEELEPLRVEFADHPWGAWQDEAAQASGRLPGGQSRWTGTKDLSFVPLAPKRVVEVGYEHMEGDRVPPHRPVQALARRPRARVVRLRPARGGRRLRPLRRPHSRPSDRRTRRDGRRGRRPRVPRPRRSNALPRLSGVSAFDMKA